jgi:hypothetical protein
MTPLELSVSDATIWSTTLEMSTITLEVSIDYHNVYITSLWIGFQKNTHKYGLDQDYFYKLEHLLVL